MEESTNRLLISDAYQETVEWSQFCSDPRGSDSKPHGNIYGTGKSQLFVFPPSLQLRSIRNLPFLSNYHTFIFNFTKLRYNRRTLQDRVFLVTQAAYK